IGSARLPGKLASELLIQLTTCARSSSFDVEGMSFRMIRISVCERDFGCYSIAVMADLIKADELKNRLKKIPEWELEKKHIERTFEFDDFSDAIDFVNAVAEVADEEEHHPDIDIRYNKVRLVLSTHSKGGLTDLDFALAERIDTLSE